MSRWPEVEIELRADDRIESVAELVDQVVPDETCRQSHWNSMARELLLGLALYVKCRARAAGERASLADVQQVLEGKTAVEICEEMRQCPSAGPAGHLVNDAQRWLTMLTECEASCVVSTAKGLLKSYGLPHGVSGVA